MYEVRPSKRDRQVRHLRGAGEPRLLNLIQIDGLAAPNENQSGDEADDSKERPHNAL